MVKLLVRGKTKNGHCILLFIKIVRVVAIIIIMQLLQAGLECIPHLLHNNVCICIYK